MEKTLTTKPLSLKEVRIPVAIFGSWTVVQTDLSAETLTEALKAKPVNANGNVND